MASHIERRKFLATLGGAAVAWPRAPRAQQPAGMRRIGVLTAFAENDAEAQANITAFRQSLEKVGWIEGRNLAIDYRWGDADPERIRNYAII
jgi:putative ABC transport system substrate-binding protein